MENYSIECLGGAQEDSGFSSPGPCFDNTSNCWSESGPGAGRRGRPKAAIITSLMKEGAVSNSGIRCEICCRVFPRDKSLQAHLRVHTGERPYSCDYPGCVRKFKQSGQLKTHQRLHTGERPFLCSAHGCNQRFTHANRHCASHPSAALIRCDNFTPYNPDTAQSDEVRLWLVRYMTEKKEPRSEKKVKTVRIERERRSSDETSGELTDMTNLQHGEIPDGTMGMLRSNSHITPLRDSGLSSPATLLPSRHHSYCSARYDDVYWSEGEESIPAGPNGDWLTCSPAWSTPLNNGRPPVKSLFVDSPSPTLSPRKRELPKKRWLRIARREEESSANSQRPTVLRYLAASPPVYSTTPVSYKVQPLPAQEAMLTPPHSTPRTAIYKSLTESSPLLSRLLTMPYDNYEEDLTPLAVPLPHD